MKDTSSTKTEVMAGVTTFLTMAYIIFVQPAVLSTDFSGKPTGLEFGAVLLALSSSEIVRGHMAVGSGAAGLAAVRAASITMVAVLGCSYAFTAYEGFRHYRMMLKRALLGLGDPVVANRFLLWAWAGSLQVVSDVVTAYSLQSGGNISTDPSAILATSLVGSVNSVLLVLCSNRGLCGGYNAAILREANQRVRQYAREGITLHLDLSGKRAINFFRYQGVRGEHNYVQFEDRPAFDEVEPIADRYIRSFISGEVDRVEVAYQKFINAAVQRPVVETLLPLEHSADGQEKAPGGPAVEYEFMPGAEDILQQILPESFKVRLFKCFLDAAVSEQIARRVTMKQATENEAVEA